MYFDSQLPFTTAQGKVLEGNQNLNYSCPMGQLTVKINFQPCCC